jgi:Predicted P-loop ATPase and inactivated derivatives
MQPDPAKMEAAATAYASAEPISIGWKRRLITSESGAPKPILANAIIALTQAPEWTRVLAYSEFSMATIARQAPPWPGAIAGIEWSDHEDRRATEWLQHHGIYVGVEIAAQAVQVAAKAHTFHAVREYLDSLTWDGTERIGSWLNLYLGAEPSDYTSAVGSRWLIQAVARIYRPGVKADTCLILEGEQGTLKSTALKTMGVHWFTDEIAELGTKDASLQTLGVWIIELSELDSMSRGEVSRIKSFMTRATDRFRPPYGRRIITSPRQCVFAGSVNHNTYLRDDTGGRRFWPVECGVIDIKSLIRDRDQLWAEAAVQYKIGAVWWLDSKLLNQAAEEQQAERLEGDPWQSEIAEWCERQWVNGETSVSIADALRLCIQKPKERWIQGDLNRISRCFRVLNLRRGRIGGRGNREWRYSPVPGERENIIQARLIIEESESEL